MRLCFSGARSFHFRSVFHPTPPTHRQRIQAGDPFYEFGRQAVRITQPSVTTRSLDPWDVRIWRGSAVTYLYIHRLSSLLLSGYKYIVSMQSRYINAAVLGVLIFPRWPHYAAKRGIRPYPFSPASWVQHEGVSHRAVHGVV